MIIPKRLLLYIPIIHTQADLGTLGEAVQRVKVRNLGQQAWEAAKHLVETRWDKTDQFFNQWLPPQEWSRVRLYQDGLPLCDWTRQIVQELASTGSRNHRLLLRLMERGAQLIGTESPELLLKEYNLAKQLVELSQQLQISRDRDTAQKITDQQHTARALLRERDRFIAERINITLQPEEVGILFLGALHDPLKWLTHEIDVSFPLYPLPSRSSRNE